MKEREGESGALGTAARFSATSTPIDAPRKNALDQLYSNKKRRPTEILHHPAGRRQLKKQLFFQTGGNGNDNSRRFHQNTDSKASCNVFSCWTFTTRYVLLQSWGIKVFVFFSKYFFCFFFQLFRLFTRTLKGKYCWFGENLFPLQGPSTGNYTDSYYYTDSFE